MRSSSVLLCVAFFLHSMTVLADDPAPAVPKKPTVAKPAAAKPAKPDAASDEEEPPPKSAPRRFVPTDKGKADEDIPFPVDI